MLAIDTKTFRTITASTLIATGLIEGLKEYVKRQKNKSTKSSEKAHPKDQLTEKSINSINLKSRKSGIRTSSPIRSTAETEEALNQLRMLEFYAWLPTAMAAFEEIALNKWIPATNHPYDITIAFFNSLVRIRDQLRCRNPNELASALVSIAACFVDGTIPWDTYIELDSKRYVRLEELFWGPGGIGRPNEFWADAYRANKTLPQINPAELAILTVMESQGYDKPGEKRKTRSAEEAVPSSVRERAMKWRYSVESGRR
jgi:hypothetical protein